MRFTKVCFFIISIFTYYTECAKILGIFHMASYSHYQLGDRLMKSLAVRGHEVTLVVPFPEKGNTQNYTHIFLENLFEDTHGVIQNLFDVHGANPFLSIININKEEFALTEMTLNHPKVQALIRSNEHFDLVIIENFLNDAFKGFCYRFNAPCVAFSSFGSSRWSNRVMGNPSPPSYVPDINLSFNTKLNFLGRLYNSLIYLFGELNYYCVVFPKHNEFLQKYFPGAPNLNEIHYNTSLMLLNSHVSTNIPVPRVPGMIDIGGFHVGEPKKLPQDLQSYLDNSKEGVILFSMGSILKSVDMPVEKLQSILSSFSKLKQNVLWKWEDENLPNKPKNVKITKWLPQQDILAHPNLKLFISHGGLLSTIEAVYFGVPVMGIPIFGDQGLNIEMAQSAGYALSIPYSTLNEKILDEALREMLSNPKYSKIAKYRSKIMHDEPIKPMDKAMFWIEYVLRHQGAPHLRVAALDLNWFSYILLDVVAFVVLAMCISIFIFYVITKKVLTFFKNREKSEKNKKNN